MRQICIPNLNNNNNGVFIFMACTSSTNINNKKKLNSRVCRKHGASHDLRKEERKAGAIGF